MSKLFKKKKLSWDHFTKVCVYPIKEFKHHPKSNGKSSSSFTFPPQMTFLSIHLHGLTLNLISTRNYITTNIWISNITLRNHQVTCLYIPTAKNLHLHQNPHYTDSMIFSLTISLCLSHPFPLLANFHGPPLESHSFQRPWALFLFYPSILLSWLNPAC